jgi:molybdopterin-guanine dinucleotide biosynthesis protein A
LSRPRAACYVPAKSADNFATMVELEGFILAGGASSRMGSDKALLRLGDETFVERVARALSHVTDKVGVVSSRHGGELSRLPVVPDFHEGCGALGGLHSALAHARAPWVFVVSCDLPFVTGGLCERLTSFVDAGVEAVVPVQEDGRWQPLCALYERRPCLPLSERLLLEGERRPRALIAHVETFRADFRLLSDLPGSQLFFNNLNSPEDYDDAREALYSPEHANRRVRVT